MRIKMEESQAPADCQLHIEGGEEKGSDDKEMHSRKLVVKYELSIAQENHDATHLHHEDIIWDLRQVEQEMDNLRLQEKENSKPFSYGIVNVAGLST